LAKEITELERAIYEEIAAHAVQGTEAAQIAIDAGLGTEQQVREIMRRADFHTVFSELDHEAYTEWVENEKELEAVKAVKSQVRERASTYVDQLHALVSGGDLKPEKRADILLALLKVSGTVSEDVVEEVIKLPAKQIAALDEARKAIDEEREGKYGPN
jgi:hypothetical protein